jgi:hypothetical protein
LSFIFLVIGIHVEGNNPIMGKIEITGGVAFKGSADLEERGRQNKLFKSKSRVSCIV